MQMRVHDKEHFSLLTRATWRHGWYSIFVARGTQMNVTDQLDSYWRNDRKPCCGIYRIVNKVSGKSYVGQSTNIGDRWISHLSPNGSMISEAISLSPVDFTFEILELCLPENLNDRENYYISFYRCITNGYNVKCGNGMVKEQQTFDGPMTEEEARKAANKVFLKPAFSKNNAKHLWKMQ